MDVLPTPKRCGSSSSPGPRLAVRRGLPVRPVTGRDPEPQDPVNVEAAFGAVEREVLELAFEIGLHLEELKPQHLRVDRDRVIASTSSLRLVNELVSLDGLLGDGVDGVLEDLAFSACHVQEG
jgi:hypothetical protein